MGRFLLGSTVVMLFPQDSAGAALRFNPAWAPAGPVRLGQVMANIGA
jgi:phosphatidylserine decarboxylase